MKHPKIIRADFVTSAPSITHAPPEEKSEVVFMGRSNVGKSSTLNTLCERKSLAKSSATPGKTRLINFFDAEYRYENKLYPVRFVDLPGFGYAKVSKSIKEIWQKNLAEFIKERRAVRLFIHLRDARHPKMQIDNEVEAYLSGLIRADQRYLCVFTKIDKLNQKERTKLQRLYPDAIMLSNTKKSGFDRLHIEILNTIFGIGHEKES